MTREERIAGGFWGLLVGDALGVPYEFKPAGAIGPRDQIELEGPVSNRSHGGVPYGTWSDDGAQALCLLESLLEMNRLDPDDLMERWISWWRHGHRAVDGRVFDVGIQTTIAFQRYVAGTPVLAAANGDERANGNGSLMRVLPLALWHRGSDAELMADAELSSRPTHGHRRAGVCCAVYVLWARRILEGAPEPWRAAVATARALLDGEGRSELEDHVCPDDPAPGWGTGYVVDALRSARHCVENTGSYADAVRAAIALGNDTDTTACITGGIAGLVHGESGIPARWRAALRGRDLAEPLLRRLVIR